ncbi:matrix metalloproteinase-17b [Pangasianodon hypophthalmus]|uniref:matrix metalloproteinase-17b n=1 Tax=Pangasianodon hypophthalmus TaxID=310915 RepID=UPI002306E815|nr:matrix metalloproteinase-17b [Pangasianodon hypophthalmus]
MKVLQWTVLTLSLCGCKWALSVPLAPPLASVTPETPPTVTPTVDESARLVDWLMKYGYLPPPDPSTGQLQAWTAVTHALKAMQRFAGLHDTGTLDEETLRLMQTPRCSLPDDEGSQIPESDSDTELQGQRVKRAISSWDQRNINWRLHTYPTSSALSHDTFRSLVFYALKVWAEPTALEFHEVGGPEGADLLIDFLHGSHGDGYPFDGAGGAVGHAFFPSDPERAGEVHLDAEEEWAFRQPASEGTDAFTVLVHELGHALGLSHSSARGSVMRPYYQGPLGDPLHFSLGSPDREHITALYGKRGDHLQTDSPLEAEAELKHPRRGTHRLTHMHRHTHSQLDSPSLDRCNTSFDAVAKIRGETFFFKGLNMWRVNRGNLVSRRAVSVRKLWAALPTSLPPLRAVLERHEDHAIIFISGSQFWLFKDLSLQDGFPQPLSALNPAGLDGEKHGVHWDPDKGVVWRSGGERGESGQVWTELIEGGVNGIITENNGSLFLFKGSHYWKFAHPGSAPGEGFPRPVASDWLNCPDPSSQHPGDISLTSIVSQQELQDRKEEGALEQIRHWDKTTTRHTENPQDCPCSNSPSRANTSLHFLMISLLLHTLTYQPSVSLFMTHSHPVHL